MRCPKCYAGLYEYGDLFYCMGSEIEIAEKCNWAGSISEVDSSETTEPEVFLNVTGWL